ncbi:CDP-alcohol phosphatidyltransferase family protein [Frankia sp. CNm7]|uniref:Phosphatidylinositol phosphate synthase n=1 Tax=Frankia nepalensis TaxID=1836974 RepID=A0A937RQ60_9ACTN|nr:CDP-alcohol phosphatidyltransferase family protein [Frankia nepalensis]MBL7494760.1 CDP-alcohol phosphatidyltransferase family protein [Frankia nepalensis]MBL7514019.1 CDP-alcohol phosphatidyltransferase family protein [Frankia nepalensis]MBL7521821.1 CDP-alcohol phosphatidyltransferase family protein [Frankia nepalensis]MBL7629951.1 CDP-alcohol phosphatidyltransferase family protein [Frankia nepalensis]
MLASKARPQINRLLEPFSRWAARTSLSPDLVTIIGTIGVVGGALGFFTRGVFFLGTIVITLFVFSDLIDGAIARARGISSKWGAFLDSTSDRLGDGAVFGSLVIWYAGEGDSLPLAGAALISLVAAAVTSYVKARAESLGFTCDVGLAERGERLLLLLVAAGLYGLGVPYLLPVALWVLAAATVITVAQRIWHVYRQFQGTGGSAAAASVPTAGPTATVEAPAGTSRDDATALAGPVGAVSPVGSAG